MITEGNIVHSIHAREYSWETKEKWDHPTIYVVQTNHFTEYDLGLLRNALSNEELTRSKRFRQVRQRESFIITHALFRLKLGSFLNEKPELIQVEKGFLGKPFLTDFPEIHFNLSHCNGVSLIAFDLKNEIGVDVEEIKPGFDWEPVAKRFYSPAENDLIRSSGENELYTFHRLWTRKEALVKSHGSGINEMNLRLDVRSDYTDEQFFLKTLLYLRSYVITTAVAYGSGKVDIYLPGNNCFTFNV
ncbi:MAG: 4'-phosphopantetheinyl transferase family protein [Syntrophothermus sp.]